MKKIITSIILISAFLLTSCKAESVNPEIKSENPAVLSDNNISEVKYYKAEELKINPSEVIGIKDNFILSNQAILILEKQLLI